MKNNKVRNHIGIIAALFALIIPGVALAINVSPEEVLISATYNGEIVDVIGNIGADEEVVVQVVGSSSEAHFKQKGKVGGIFWMTVGHLAISDAPSAYLVYLPKEISDWRQSNDQRWQNLQFDYASLLPTVKIEPEPKDKKQVFADFLKLKNQDGLYQIVENGVTYEIGQNGKKKFNARLRIPAKIPVARYDVIVTRIKDGVAVGVEKSEFHMKEVGFPLLISNLAFNNSLIYGILAVLIAIFAGLFMGLMFRDKGGAH